MLTFSEAQVWQWLSPLLWPFFRVLALFAVLPILSQRSTPIRVRVGLAFLVALSAQASLPVMPVVPLDSPVAFMILLQQVIIGISIGFTVRLIFAAIELAGEIIGLQMGLNFAGFFDPITASQSTAVSRFFSICISWLFIIINGHLMVIAVLVNSFESFPVAPVPMEFLKTVKLHTLGAEIFSLGLWIALPLVAMLLFINLVLGVISRVAQQLSIFSIGFPLTVSVGLIGIFFTLPMMEQPFVMTLERLMTYFY